MTKKQVVSKFMDWIDKKKTLKAEIEQFDAGKGKSKHMQFKIMEYTKSGVPWTTICIEFMKPGMTEVDGWYEVIKRKCSGTLNIDQFKEIGIGQCGSIEEFVFKLEIAS